MFYKFSLRSQIFYNEGLFKSTYCIYLLDIQIILAYVEALNFAKYFLILALIGSNVDYERVDVYSRVLIVLTESDSIF